MSTRDFKVRFDINRQKTVSDRLAYGHEPVKFITELASILGIKSISTISEIKAERQNIQLHAWESFKRKFSSELSESFSLEGPKRDSQPLEDDYKAKYYEQLEKHNKVINEMFQTIKSQQETIHFLTTKQGNASGRTATAV